MQQPWWGWNVPTSRYPPVLTTSSWMLTLYYTVRLTALPCAHLTCFECTGPRRSTRGILQRNDVPAASAIIRRIPGQDSGSRAEEFQGAVGGRQASLQCYAATAGGGGPGGLVGGGGPHTPYLVPTATSYCLSSIHPSHSLQFVLSCPAACCCFYCRVCFVLIRLLSARLSSVACLPRLETGPLKTSTGSDG